MRDGVTSEERDRSEPLKAPLVQAQWRTHQMKREGFTLARCTVDRLMKQLGIRGAVRGKVVKTTVPDTSVPCPRDIGVFSQKKTTLVNRQFRSAAPNMLWVSDFTYVSTWQGFIYVAFVIDTFADRIVGWRVSRSAKTDFVLDALEQALYDRRPVQKGGLIHHSDRPFHGLLCKPLPGSGTAIFVHSLHRASGRSWHRTIAWQRWGLV
jgi:transposase InsO family protein